MGVGIRGFPKPEPGASIYLFYLFIYFSGGEQRKGDDLNLAFYFLLLFLSHSQKTHGQHTWAVREQGLLGVWSGVEKFLDAFCVKRVEVVGILEEGILLVLVVAFFFF